MAALRSCRRRARRGGVPASHVARGRSAAAHPRPGREPRPRTGRALVGARWPAAVRARAGGELRLPGGAARRADADARGGVVAGSQRDRRARRRAEAGAAGVQPAARGDRSGAGRARDVGPARGRGRRAGDPADQTRRPHASASSSPAGGPARPSWASATRSSSGCSAASTRRSWTRLCGSGSSSSSPRPTGLTQRASTFTRRECLPGAVRARSRRGALVDARAIEAATDRFLASPHAIALLPRDAGGRGVSAR